MVITLLLCEIGVLCCGQRDVAALQLTIVDMFMTSRSADWQVLVRYFHLMQHFLIQFYFIN